MVILVAFLSIITFLLIVMCIRLRMSIDLEIQSRFILNKEYDELYDEHSRLHGKYLSLISKNIKLMDDFHSFVRDLNENSTIGGDSKIHVKINNCNIDENQLKRLKYYIHPDKHQGKTNDLFILLDNLDKNS